MGDHLPNLLTLTRIALVPAFVAAFWLPLPAGRWVAFVVFVVAAIMNALAALMAWFVLRPMRRAHKARVAAEPGMAAPGAARAAA